MTKRAVPKKRRLPIRVARGPWDAKGMARKELFSQEGQALERGSHMRLQHMTDR